MWIVSGRAPGTLVAKATMLVLLLGSTLAFWPTPSSATAQTEAEGTGAFTVVASGEGFRFSYSVPGFAVVDTPLDFGAGVAQALVDSLGKSQAFASSPYPGDLGITGPGLVAGVLGLPAPPAYPWYAASTHPTQPEGKVSQGLVELSAKSEELVSTASAQQGIADPAGVFLAKTTADARRVADSDQVVAEATFTGHVINVGGVLRIGQVVTQAKVTRSPAGEPQRESGLQVTGVSIAGQEVGFSDKGFTVGPGAAPLPDSSPLREPLKQAGITVEYVGAQPTPDGVVSPALRIRQEIQAPQTPKQIIDVVVGRTTASATLSGTSSGAEDIIAPGPESTPGGAITEAPPLEPSTERDTSAGAGVPTGLTGTAPTGNGVQDAIASPSASGGNGQALEGDVSLAPPPPTVRTASTALTASNESLYLTMALGALVALLGGLLLRFLALRWGWT